MLYDFDETESFIIDDDDGRSRDSENSEDYASGDDHQLDSDIRYDIERALKKSTSANATSFSFRKGYPDAPNPVLDISGVGIVGLPLSKRDAEAIKKHASQAPFGKGKKTVVDKSVRDTWEINPSKIVFKHPEWPEYLDRVVKEVCETLGVNVQASKPRCELHKLLLYETGSHFLPHVDTEKANGMFATLIIVLPSEFTGGAAHLSHGDLSVVYDTSARSLFETTALAWYTDVTHEIKPLTSGHRLALSYNLIHTTKALRPALSSSSALVDRLTRIFGAWQAREDGGEDVPEKIVCLLEHKYSQANLSGGALKGGDAQRVAMIDTAAKRHRFGMGFASAECHLFGTADDEDEDGYYEYRRRPQREEHDFLAVFDQDLEVEHVVDLDGNMIADKLQVNVEKEAVPSELIKILRQGPWEDENHQPYTGNESASLERWYRRTVLIIWPPKNRLAITYSGEAGFAQACKKLAKAMSAKPSADALELARSLLARTDYDEKHRAVREVARAACAWNDAALWDEAMTRMSGRYELSMIPAETRLEALKTFGLQKVKESFERMFLAELSLADRLRFLHELEEWLDGCSPSAKKKLSKGVNAWIADRMKEALDNVDCAYLTHADVESLVDLAGRANGLAMLEQAIIPRLQEQVDGDSLLELATRLSQSGIGKSSDIILTLVSSAIPKLSAYDRGLYEPSDGWAQNCIQTCVDLKLDDLAMEVVDQVLQQLSKKSVPEAQKFAMQEIIPLVPFCMEALKAPEGRQAAEKLREKGVQLVLDSRGGPQNYGIDDFRQLFNVAVLDGLPDMLLTKVIPALEATPLTADEIKAAVGALDGGLEARLTVRKDDRGRTVHDVRRSLTEKYTDVISLDSTGSVLAAIDWCGTPFPELISRILDRATDGEKTKDAAYVKGVLVPLIPKLAAWARERGVFVSITATFRKILLAYVDRALGPVPDLSRDFFAELEKIRTWTCRSKDCDLCPQVKNFLLESGEDSLYLDSIGSQKAKHIEGKLKSYAPHTARYHENALFHGRRMGLAINKLDALRDYTAFKAAQALGLTALKSITDDENQLKTILGPDQARIHAALHANPQGDNPAHDETGKRPAKKRKVEGG